VRYPTTLALLTSVTLTLGAAVGGTSNAAEGLLTLTLDDIDKSQCRMFEIMSDRQLVASNGVVTSFIGNNACLTLAQLQEMYDAGWEIASHGVYHTRLTSLALTEEDAGLTAWSPLGGYTNTWFLTFTFEDVGRVFEDDRALARKSNIDEVEASPGSFWFDEVTRFVYVHTSDGAAPALHDMRADSAERELRDSHARLLELFPGSSPDSFFPPYNAINGDVADIASRYFTSVSAGPRDGTPNTIPVDDPYMLRRFPLNAGTTLSEAKDAISQAIDSGRWIILLAHKLGDPTLDYYAWAEQDFAALMEWIDDEGIRMVTQREGTILTADPDSDGVASGWDNCMAGYNADQRDTDGDGIGNRCDADLDNNCFVDFVDLGMMKAVFYTDDADADLNGDGTVNFVDLGIMKSAFFTPPGPSGVPNICDAFSAENRRSRP
jgi:peptidoglycan/xylan/chitin deacetylase (PgdA/CDA1 family)